jgi:hypothetical protein
MLKHHQFAVLGSVLALMLLVSPAAQADEIDQKALNRAHDFLKGADRGRTVIKLMHAWCTYVGHTPQETRFVFDGAGKKIPGAFKLRYIFDWNKNGWTDVAFVCDRRGNITDIEILGHNSVINVPFAVSNATIKIAGNGLIELFKDKMTAEERKQLQDAVDKADAKALLVMTLKFEQTFGK